MAYTRLDLREIQKYLKPEKLLVLKQVSKWLEVSGVTTCWVLSDRTILVTASSTHWLRSKVPF